MAKRLSGLGRGLSALIPQRGETSDQAKPVPAQAVSAATVAVVEASVEGGAVGNGAREISVKDISANPEQPRVMFRHQELEDLMNSIKEHGIIQPLMVSPKDDGTYELIAGERRFRAANMLGLKTVPVTIRSADAHDKLLLALIENIQREDLNPVEEARGYMRLAQEFSFTQETIAKKVGKARSTVANAIRLLDLPQEIQDAIAGGLVSAGSARAILGLKDEKSRIKLFKRLVGSKLSTREVEAGVRKKRGISRKDPSVLAAEEELRNIFGTRVEVRKKDGKGTVAITFHSDEEYEALLKRFLTA